MNKQELITAMSAETGLTQRECENAVNAMSYFIKKSVKNGSDLKIYGLGTFTKIKAKARPGRNPITGKKIQIPAQWRVKFRASQEFKNYLA